MFLVATESYFSCACPLCTKVDKADKSNRGNNREENRKENSMVRECYNEKANIKAHGEENDELPSATAMKP